MAVNPIAKVYADLIRDKKVNPATGEAWKLEDVPSRLRDEVEKILNENK